MIVIALLTLQICMKPEFKVHRRTKFYWGYRWYRLYEYRYIGHLYYQEKVDTTSDSFLGSREGFAVGDRFSKNTSDVNGNIRFHFSRWNTNTFPSRINDARDAWWWWSTSYRYHTRNSNKIWRVVYMMMMMMMMMMIDGYASNNFSSRRQRGRLCIFFFWFSHHIIMVIKRQ